MFGSLKKIVLAVIVVLFGALQFCNAEELYNLGGGKFEYKEITDSSKAVLFLWTTWCPYCRRELSRLNAMCGDFAGIDFFYINLGESKSKVIRIVSRLGLSECILKKMILDPGSYIAEKHFVVGIPAYIFLKDGKTVDKANYVNKWVLKKVFGDE